MISFDFSHSAPPEFLRRVSEFRIPERYYAALLAIAGVVLTVGGAWLIESHRLHDTLALQTVYQQRYDESVRALKRANVYEARVKRIVALAAKIRSIRSSGYADARRLAEIANNLPPHAWLTSIAYDGDAISLEGRTKDLRVLGSVIRGLSRAGHLRNPLLSSAMVVSEPPQKNTIKYVLRVESGTP
jgi:Tfp pilus assembly protein PilN